MTLLELDACFLKADDKTHYSMVESITEADGIMHLCPKCFQKNGGAPRTHSTLHWQPHVPADYDPGPGRWKFTGTSLADLSLDNGPGKASSVLETGCGAHYHIKNGEIVF